MNFKAKRNIIKLKEFIIDLLKIGVGTAIMAIGIEQFLLPNQLSTGGFSGIGTIIYYLFRNTCRYYDNNFKHSIIHNRIF